MDYKNIVGIVMFIICNFASLYFGYTIGLRSGFDEAKKIYDDATYLDRMILKKFKDENML